MKTLVAKNISSLYAYVNEHFKSVQEFFLLLFSNENDKIVIHFWLIEIVAAQESSHKTTT